jgi:adenosylhomocysteine nucleosidase
MNYVLSVALSDELEGIQGNYNTLLTGVGKINATLALTKYLTENPDIDTVINYGTAGGVDKTLKGLLHIGKFVQGDMDCTEFGFDKYQTPFESNTQEIVFDKNGYICYTQDKFATSVPDGECHCVDMEAYALAKVCLSFSVKFKCIKFISDIVGEGNQATEWENNKAKGVEMFEQSLKQLIGE